MTYKPIDPADYLAIDEITWQIAGHLEPGDPTFNHRRYYTKAGGTAQPTGRSHKRNLNGQPEN